MEERGCVHNFSALNIPFGTFLVICIPHRDTECKVCMYRYLPMSVDVK